MCFALLYQNTALCAVFYLSLGETLRSVQYLLEGRNDYYYSTIIAQPSVTIMISADISSEISGNSDLISAEISGNSDPVSAEISGSSDFTSAKICRNDHPVSCCLPPHPPHPPPHPPGSARSCARLPHPPARTNVPRPFSGPGRAGPGQAGPGRAGFTSCIALLRPVYREVALFHADVDM